jgi:tetratricopeptide (TPR) repeat protein
MRSHRVPAPRAAGGGRPPTGVAAVAAACLLVLASSTRPPTAGAQEGGGVLDMDADAGEAGDPRDAQARALFEAGSALYAAGQFGAAAERFAEAYALSERPALLYNMYVAYRDAGQPGRAADALARYLDAVPDARDRVTLEARLRSLQAQAAGSGDGGDPGEPGDARDPVDEGPETSPVAPAREARSGPSPALRALPFLVGGLGAAAIVAGTTTGVLALRQRNDLEDACPQDRCPFDFAGELDGDQDRLERLSVATDALLVSGVVLVVTGVVLWAVGVGQEDEAPGERIAAPRWEPVAGCTGDGCLAGVRGSF